MAPAQYRLAEIERHNKENDLWFIVDRKVYDVSKFADFHPGGPQVLMNVAGNDASNGFKANGHSDSAREELETHCIGEVHPDDVHMLKAPLQGTRSNTTGIAIVFVLLAICIYCIIHSLV